MKLRSFILVYCYFRIRFELSRDIGAPNYHANEYLDLNPPLLSIAQMLYRPREPIAAHAAQAKLASGVVLALV